MVGVDAKHVWCRFKSPYFPIFKMSYFVNTLLLSFLLYNANFRISICLWESTVNHLSFILDGFINEDTTRNWKDEVWFSFLTFLVNLKYRKNSWINLKNVKEKGDRYRRWTALKVKSFFCFFKSEKEVYSNIRKGR